MAKSNPVELAAEIVAAFVSNNPLPKSELPTFVDFRRDLTRDFH
jgi:predicted transcriptional regulator